jgi:hypothetical protein
MEKVIHVKQEGSSSVSHIILAILSFIGGLFTSIQSQINVIVSAIERPNQISDLTKRIFLVRKSGSKKDTNLEQLE